LDVLITGGIVSSEPVMTIGRKAMALKLVHNADWPTEEDKQLSSTSTQPDCEEGAYIVVFVFGYYSKTRVTIRYVLNDKQSGADMVITNMTVLPAAWCGHGFGTTALQLLIKHAIAQGHPDIRAVQVQGPSEQFWSKNGFKALNNVTNDFSYVAPR
jgi:hypothetical protein